MAAKTWACDVCGKLCRGAIGLAVHRRKAHGIRGKEAHQKARKLAPGAAGRREPAEDHPWRNGRGSGQAANPHTGEPDPPAEQVADQPGRQIHGNPMPPINLVRARLTDAVEGFSLVDEALTDLEAEHARLVQRVAALEATLSDIRAAVTDPPDAPDAAEPTYELDAPAGGGPD